MSVLSPGGRPAADVIETSDAVAGVGTAYALGSGELFQGTISSASDSDWIAITLEAGQDYVISAWGAGSYGTGLANTELTLRDASGAFLAYVDDFADSNPFSALEFTATVSGTYYVQVDGYRTSAGNYRLTWSGAELSHEQVATQITEIGWGNTVLHAFDVSVDRIISVNLTALTAAGQQLARWALGAWADLTGLVFQETGSSGANIVFDDNQAGAWASYSANPNTGELLQSWVNVSTNWLATYGTSVDSYSMQTYLHEIGHALGLAHGGPYNGSASYGTDNYYTNDSVIETLMSYFFPYDNPWMGASAGTVVTPMIADVIAIQRLYGTPDTINAGDTVYGANATVGGYLGTLFGILHDGDGASASFYRNQPVIMTLVDSGGIDTLDLSSSTIGNRVDLAPGSYSDINGRTANLGIAVGTILENVIGGAGADTILGNDADNRIEGGRGDDTIDGGGGIDTAVLRIARAAAGVADLGGGAVRVVSTLGTDLYRGIELFAFDDGTLSLAQLLGATNPIDGTQGADRLDGTDGADRVALFGGNDVFHGGGGDDIVDAGYGADEIHGDGGNDTIHGMNGFDLLFGGDGDDTLHGNAGNDTIHGDGGNDRIYGGIGADLAYGGDGADEIDAGDGHDTLYGGIGDDILRGNAGNDALWGDAGSDWLYGGIGADSLHGGDGADRLYGGGGGDTLDGGAGNDRLYGNAGDDILDGGAGDDILNGGIGADVFVFRAGYGNDRIQDLGLVDRIRIDAGLAPGLAVADDLRGYATEVDGSLVFDFGADTLTIAGLVNLDFVIGQTDLA